MALRLRARSWNPARSPRMSEAKNTSSKSRLAAIRNIQRPSARCRLACFTSWAVMSSERCTLTREVAAHTRSNRVAFRGDQRLQSSAGAEVPGGHWSEFRDRRVEFGHRRAELTCIRGEPDPPEAPFQCFRLRGLRHGKLRTLRELRRLRHRSRRERVEVGLEKELPLGERRSQRDELGLNRQAVVADLLQVGLRRGSRGSARRARQRRSRPRRARPMRRSDRGAGPDRRAGLDFGARRPSRARCPSQRLCRPGAVRSDGADGLFR